ncbi:DEAD/DEAH box helicase [Facklamia sp. DSM 111018]|uniref:DEAD/DEAH box helicase n=1 Tax=Facklamia lactis TaxID=2749967 RepID=A0ABS0LR92_9LACT|nr:DEAD/DEAH box helicase [Facklamia lactis]MBG9980074.1 DEAD/DEAH box helicase [Facklamia lactis]MBG9985876.1 DEAD/DEAH box helicase [Facklamia lactis]
MKFIDLDIKNFLKDGLTAIHFEELTAVQEAVIPKSLKKESLIVQSQTGSGKTHAFLIPILDQIDPLKNEVQGVVTAPSRELANQLYEVAQELVAFSKEGIRVANYVGGTDKLRQIEKLDNQQPHLVIGTPGRIFDLMSANALWVQTASMLVIDEADMTLDLGFLPIVDEIASRMAQDLQMMAFSATIPQQLSVFLNKYMVNPQHVKIEAGQVLVDQVDNYLINTKGQDRKRLVYDLLTMGHPFLAMVFCNTREYANELSQYLKDQGLKVATIHGGVEPRERKRIMKQVKNLDYQYVVASDLAARGIDIPGISLVINTELPQDLEFFVHRVGRTARNQLAGTAYTFITPDDDKAVASLEAKGIEFTEVTLSKGEIKEVEQRYRRSRRQNTQRKESDPRVKALINRNKKAKVKPGYKRKLTEEIKEHRRSQAKRQTKLNNRRARKK